MSAPLLVCQIEVGEDNSLNPGDGGRGTGCSGVGRDRVTVADKQPNEVLRARTPDGGTVIVKGYLVVEPVAVGREPSPVWSRVSFLDCTRAISSGSSAEPRRCLCHPDAELARAAERGYGPSLRMATDAHRFPPTELVPLFGKPSAIHHRLPMVWSAIQSHDRAGSLPAFELVTDVVVASQVVPRRPCHHHG